MRAYIKNNFLRQSVLAFTGMPLLIWTMGNFPERSLLKESLSVMTILAFYQIIGQFFWTRTNRSAVANLKMSKVIKFLLPHGTSSILAVILALSCQS